MKFVLSLAISAWIGYGGGAFAYERLADFWTSWLIFGLVILVLTTIYILERRQQWFSR